MLLYITKRILLVPVTLLGIILINFTIAQFAPGGPIEQIVAKMMMGQVSTTQGISGGGDMGMSSDALAAAGTVHSNSTYGLDPDLLEDLKKQFGFDKPAHVRFFEMVWSYIQFDYGESYFQNRPVHELVIERFPVSISLGLWSLLLIYGISVPLGVRKAVKDGTHFDFWSSSVIFVGYAIPGFLFAIVLILLFAGGQSTFNWFPLQGLTSANWGDLAWLDKILDYFWHITLPVIALTVGGFAYLTMLTKNSFLEEINKQFVLTARAKGIDEKRVLFGHIFRNAMLIVIAGFPSALIGILFTGSLLIEVIFNLNGLGLLSYDAVIKRDYPIMFGTLYCFSLIGLIMHLIGDLCYVLIDPRIDFETRQ